jgi:hypothetical protein
VQAAIELNPQAGTVSDRLGLSRKMVASVAIVVLLGWLAATSARAALDRAATGQGLGFDHAPPSLQVRGGASLDLAAGTPTDRTASDVTVRLSDGPAVVRLFGRTGGTGLDRFLELTVTRGSGRGAAFRPDAVIYSGNLTKFPTSEATAIGDPGGTWDEGEAHTYRFQVRLRDVDAAQGRTATQSFAWSAAAA